MTTNWEPKKGDVVVVFKSVIEPQVRTIKSVEIYKWTTWVSHYRLTGYDGFVFWGSTCVKVPDELKNLDTEAILLWYALQYGDKNNGYG